MVGIIAVIACIIIAGAVVFSAIPAFLRTTSQPSPSNNSPSVLSIPSTTSSNIRFITSNKSGNSSLFRDQRDNEEWLTYHHDLLRTGFDPYKPASYSASSIHENWTSSPLDGAIYAEPLIAKSMVFVATENNTIYSLDAATGRLIWRTHLGSPVPLSHLPCGNIDPTGITGTPVIDMRTQTIFAVAFLSDTHSHKLFALDVSTGKIRFETDVDPPNSDPLVHQQRGALALSYYNDSSNAAEGANPGQKGGILVYIPFGGLFGDCGQFHGWVMGAPISYTSLANNNNYNISNSSASSIGIETRGTEQIQRQQLPLLSFQVPTHREGGIWAPSGPAIDRDGNILVATGNGDSKTNFDFSNSVIKLSPDLGKVVDWFAPSNWADLSGSDTDLGSVGPAVLDNNVSDSGNNNDTEYTNTTPVIFQIGKEGVGYLLRGDKLGGLNGQIFSAPVCDKGAYGGTAYSAPYLYVPCRDGLVALYLQSAADSNTTTTAAAATTSGSTPPGTSAGGIVNASKSNNSTNGGADRHDSNDYSSFTIKWKGPSFRAGPPIIADGLVWTVDINKGKLYAFDQSSGNILFQTDVGDEVHFTTASSSHGQIFVAASDSIMSFSTN